VEVQNQNGEGDTGGGAISRGQQTAAAAREWRWCGCAGGRWRGNARATDGATRGGATGSGETAAGAARWR
jgi:hypothetical protein